MQAIRDFLAAIEATAAEAVAAGAELAEIGERLAAAVATWREATEWLIANGAGDPNDALAGATPYLRMSGIVIGGWLLTRSALAAAGLRDGDGGGFSDDFLAQKLVTARFYATQLLPQAAGLAPAVTAGNGDLAAAVLSVLSSHDVASIVHDGSSSRDVRARSCVARRRMSSGRRAA